VLERTPMSESKRMRFMVAWCTYYNPGIAAEACERTGGRFWDYLFTWYGHAQRASERRHFRGDAGLKALRSWERQFPQPEKMIEHLQGATYFEVKRKAETVPQIGRYSPKVPQEGAKLIAPEASVADTYRAICAHLHQFPTASMSPPAHDRRMNMQEAETVCCVYHQMVGGGYWWHSRTAKAIMRLSKVPCNTSRAMIHEFGRSVEWAQDILSKEEE
jgi:hypothetical protein